MTDFDLKLLIQIHKTISSLPIHPDLIKRANGNKSELQHFIRTNSVNINDFFAHKLITGNTNEAFYSVERMKSFHILTATALYGGRALTGTSGLLKLTQLSIKLVELASKTI